MDEHPTEPVLEAILIKQQENHNDQIQMLEHILVHADNNKLDPYLEAQIVLSDKHNKELIQAIKDIPKVEIPEDKEVDLTETNKLLRELSDEVKKKEEYDYEIKIDLELKEKLKGKDGKDGANGLDGERGPRGFNGKDGKQGIQGIQGIPGSTLTQEDIEKISKGLSKTKKTNLLFANSGVNEVRSGSGISIDNSNPQHPIISTTSNGSLGDSFETVSANLIAYDNTLNYNGSGDITSIVYSNGVTKTFNYTGADITSIVLSGSTPAGITLTKTLTHTSGDVTSIDYT